VHWTAVATVKSKENSEL